jgi:hypothetical protein
MTVDRREIKPKLRHSISAMILGYV